MKKILTVLLTIIICFPMYSIGWKLRTKKIECDSISALTDSLYLKSPISDNGRPVPKIDSVLFGSDTTGPNKRIPTMTDLDTAYAATGSSVLLTEDQIAIGGVSANSITGSNNLTHDGIRLINQTIYGTDTSIFIGSKAGNSTASQHNVAIGNYALHNIQSGTSDNYNIAIGSYALAKQQTNENLAIGPYSMFNSTTGNQNVAIGYQNLFNLTTGGQNTAIGYYVMYSNTTGIHNTAIGIQSMDQNTTGSYNTALGSLSLSGITTGSYNIAIGRSAGNWLSTMSNRLIIGQGDSSNCILYGYMNTDAFYNQTLYANAHLKVAATLTVDSGLTVNGDLTVSGHTEINRYEVAAYLHPDSTIATSISTDWTFLGDGSNNKFTNFDVEGFSFDGDTLQFDQDADDTRDSIEFNLSYSSESATTNVNKSVFIGIFVKSTGGDYRELLQLTRRTRTITADVFYPGPTCSVMPLYLKDGDKIQIRARCAVSTTTLSVASMGIYLKEE